MKCPCLKDRLKYVEQLNQVRTVAKKYAVKHGVIVAIFKTCTTGADFREFAGRFDKRDIEYLTPYY